MNNLLIFTRSYVRKDGTWDLSIDTIRSMKNLLSKSQNIRWVVYKSGTINKESKSSRNYIEFQHLLYGFLCEKVVMFTEAQPKSCSEARIELYKKFLDKTHNIFGYWKPEFFMNLDSDDTISNEDALISLNFSDKIEDDLVGFGLEFTGGEAFSKEWDFNFDKFVYSRRYVTTEIQTMFLFLHRIGVIEYAMSHYLKGDGYLKTEPVGSPNESCDDTLMALDVALHNSDESIPKFKIGALCANLINYHFHPGQVSENQQSEYKNSIKSKLWDLGYLYVNSGNFYLPKNGKLEKFNPYDIARERNIIK